MCPTVQGLALLPAVIYSPNVQRGVRPLATVNPLGFTSNTIIYHARLIIQRSFHDPIIMIFYAPTLTLLLLQLTTATARTFTVVNECSFTIWHVPAPSFLSLCVVCLGVLTFL